MVHGGTCQGGVSDGVPGQNPLPQAVQLACLHPLQSAPATPPPPPHHPQSKNTLLSWNSLAQNLHPPPPTPLPYSPNHSTVAPGLQVIKAVVRGIGEKCVLFNQPIRNGFIPQTANQNQILFSIREGFISQSTNQRRFYPAAVRVPGGHGN